MHPDTFLMDSYNFLTPIDERRTRYFWFQQRNVAPDDADVSKRFAASVRGAFEEDRVLLEAMQANPGKRMTVLCGHTHGAGEAQLLPNLHVPTGGAEYYPPRLPRAGAADGAARPRTPVDSPPGAGHSSPSRTAARSRPGGASGTP